MAKKLEFTSREMIKPCSQTPQHLRNLKLSLLDQLSPELYIPLVLFYPNNARDQIITNPNFETASKRSEHLRKTLSKALALFYPLAGRLRDNLYVNCNDEGAEFSEAKMAGLMLDFLKRPDLEALTKLVPMLPESREASLGGYLFYARVTVFECGGIALGLSFSHKIFDACSVAEFIKSWANISKDISTDQPEFGKVNDIFQPSMDISSGIEFVQDHNCATRRFVFEREKIESLKAKATSEDGAKNPSRVEAVSGLIWKCAMEAWSARNPGVSRKSEWCHYVNVRKRLKSSLDSKVIGNLISLFSVETNESEFGVVGVKEHAGKLRRGIRKLDEKYADPDNLSNVRRELGYYMKLMSMGDEINVYNCSSWCRFELYEPDFGWGKPVWASLVSASFKNVAVLMDTSDGFGVEAWLIFPNEVMALIETNDEFLAFASPNPGIVV